MKRRGFFAFAGGAAVAGPGMVKEAAAKAAQEMALGGRMLAGGSNIVGSAGAPIGYAQASASGLIDRVLHGNNMLAKIVGMTAAQRAKFKRDQPIYAIDPDIAGYRSISLSAKLDWQRERQLERAINERKSIWQRMAEGLEPYEENPL